MAKSLTRKLFLIGLGLYIPSFTFLIISGYTDQWPPSMPKIIGLIGVVISSIFVFIAWVGALVKMAELRRWGWFVFLFLFNWIGMLLYLIVGPETVTDGNFPPPGDHQNVTWTPYGPIKSLPH